MFYQKRVSVVVAQQKSALIKTYNLILTRFGWEDCSRLIRNHSGSRICGVILDLPTMAAGGASGSASREPVASRRPIRAPLFNEKEYFYRARVLRRAQKVAGAEGGGFGGTTPKLPGQGVV